MRTPRAMGLLLQRTRRSVVLYAEVDDAVPSPLVDFWGSVQLDAGGIGVYVWDVADRGVFGVTVPQHGR